jgi:tRNA nucleotidyltransferase (CCA-adding enzyme)
MGNTVQLLPPAPVAQKVMDALRDAGGRPLIVGGAVRDMVLGAASKDCDIEVYGLSAREIEAALAVFGEVAAVGVSFGVLKLALPNGDDLDISIPRRENKAGRGHRGFQVACDPTMTHREAASRRDFTMNALAFDPASGGVLDFFGGREDLAAGILRHTSPAFAEDPLRVLRGFQFAARFQLRLAEETVVLCQSLLPEASALPVERVWGEWEKWAAKGIHPSAGLRLLRETDWLSLYPELAALGGCDQDAQWHPEGDAWEHTLHVCDAAARFAARDNLHGDARLVLLFAALCHDLGKPTTTVVGEDRRVRSPGHEKAGVGTARAFLQRIGAPERIIKRVLPLVAEHMAHNGLPAEPRTVRRLANRLAPATIQELARVVEADHSGRPPLVGGVPENMQAILSLAEGLSADRGAPAHILMGRHLIEDLGLMPGPQFGEILKAAYAAQLDGAFIDLDGALAWVRWTLRAE